MNNYDILARNFTNQFTVNGNGMRKLSKLQMFVNKRLS